jgi:hypothetical protein
MTGVEQAGTRMKQPQMNVYARFITDESRTETAPAPVKPRRPGPRMAAARSQKPGLKKRAGLPK